MNRSRYKDIRISYIVLGFMTGLLEIFILYLALFLDHKLAFSFDIFKEFHQRIPILYFLDFSPLYTTIIAYSLASIRIRQLEKIDESYIQESHRNEAVKEVIQHLTAGNLNVKLDSEAMDHEVYNTLGSLQNKLRENLESDRKIRLEEKRRSWISNGLAEFGDVLRTNSDNYEQLGYAIISNLVNYLNINQGAFFLVEGTDEKVIKMIACHAYDRKKYPEKILKWGEGLIGSVAIEKKTYYTSKIPDSYLTITSGLGKANPQYLLIVPLVLNKQIFGIIEMASFSPIEKHQVHFVERVAENTATTLNIMTSNIRTQLLLEETQAQAAQLAVQEETVRNNIEELKNMQIEAAKQSDQFVGFTNTVNHTLIRAEFSVGGRLNYANTLFLKHLGYGGNKEVDGKHINDFIHEKDQEWFSKVWTRLAAGGAHFEGYMKLFTKTGQDFWTISTFTCMRKDDGSVDKILYLAINSTEQKEQSLDFEGQVEAINKLSPKAEFSPEGSMIFCNDLFIKTLHLESVNLSQLSVFDLFARIDRERFTEIWDQVLKGIAFNGQLRILANNNLEMWFRSTFSTVEDTYGVVRKIIFLGNDITKEKELEISMREQNLRLKETEEELRIQSLDLKMELDSLNLAWDFERNLHAEETKRYSSLMDEMPYPVLMLNNLGFVLYLNKSAETYFGIKKQDVLNNLLKTIFSDLQEDETVQHLVDPSKTTQECRMKKVTFNLVKGGARAESISITKTELSSELSYGLIIHTC